VKGVLPHGRRADPVGSAVLQVVNVEANGCLGNILGHHARQSEFSCYRLSQPGFLANVGVREGIQAGIRRAKVALAPKVLPMLLSGSLVQPLTRLVCSLSDGVHRVAFTRRPV